MFPLRFQWTQYVFYTKKFGYLFISIEVYIGYSSNCFVYFTEYIGYFPNCFAYFTASIGKSWKRHIPSKMNRFGMKLRVLRENQSGYIWNFCIYVGKDTDYSQNYPKYKTTICIVLELCRYLLHQAFRVYADSWYTGIKLAKKLCVFKTDIVGTLRQKGLHIPKDIKTFFFTKKVSVDVLQDIRTK